jgi:hypothetical protein
MMEEGKKGLGTIERYFYSKASLGQVPSHADLLLFAKKNKILVDAALSHRLRKLRHRWKFIAVFSKPKKISNYMGFSVAKYGTLFIDLGYYTYYEPSKDVEGDERAPEKMKTRSTREIQLANTVTAKAIPTGKEKKYI